MKAVTTVSLLSGAFLAAASYLTWIKPEEPNMVGRAFFSAVHFKDSSHKNMSTYGSFLHVRYVTDMIDVVNDRYKYYYDIDRNTLSGKEVLTAISNGPTKPIEPFVEEALILNAASPYCGDSAYTKQAVQKCLATTEKLEREAITAANKLIDQKALNSPYIPQIGTNALEKK